MLHVALHVTCKRLLYKNEFVPVVLEKKITLHIR